MSLDQSGLSVSPLVFGANVFGWALSEAASFNMLDALVDHGINLIDTADVYSGWFPGNQGDASETIIGKWTQWPGLSATNIATAVEDSLRRLQTDRIDVCFSHIDDINTHIASATSISQLQALADATSLRLSPDDVTLLDTASHWQA